MAEFEVTAISYLVGRDLPHDEAAQVAHQFICEHLKPGTPLLLVAEPSNPYDENAIGVYLNYTTQIGRIRASRCLEVKPSLDEDGLCDAVVTGDDGHITLYIEIPSAAQAVLSTERKRTLPENPLAKELRMMFTDEERALEVVGPRLSKLEPTVENARRMMEMVERYLPLSHLSICYEDNLWRSHILANLRKTVKLELEPEVHDTLKRQESILSSIEGDQVRSSDYPQQHLMEAQLQKLTQLAEDSLMPNFEYHIATSGLTVNGELEKLKRWFREMPRLDMRDYLNHEKLANGLFYQRVSRKELYEVYASKILLERYTCMESSHQDLANIKAYVMKVKDLLSADWTEHAYEALWDKILALPSVKAVVKVVGKQKHTTFNRKLVANILHLMMQKGVFSPSATNQAMAEALEGTKDHSVRAEVGTAIEDRAIKAAVERLIAEKN